MAISGWGSRPEPNSNVNTFSGILHSTFHIELLTVTAFETYHKSSWSALVLRQNVDPNLPADPELEQGRSPEVPHLEATGSSHCLERFLA